MRVERVLAEAESPRGGRRAYAVAGVLLLGLGGLVALKLWILLRLVLAHFS